MSIAVFTLFIVGCQPSPGLPYRGDDGRSSNYSNAWMGDLDEILWKVRLDAPVWGAVAVAESAVYVVDETGSLRAISPEGDETWATDVGAPSRGTPVVANSRVLVGHDGGLSAVNFDGAVQWNFDAGAVEGAPLVLDGVVYFGARDGKIRAVDVVGGSLIWEAVTAGPVTAAGVACAGAVVFGSEDGGVYSLERDTGELRWSWNGGAAVRGLSSSNGVVFVSARHTLAAVKDADPEAAAWTVDVANGATTAPAVDGDRIAIGTGTGEVVFVERETGAPSLKRQVARVLSGDLHIVGNNLVLPMGRDGVGVFAGGEELSWTFVGDDAIRGITPADGRLYVTDAAGSVYALR